MRTFTDLHGLALRGGLSLAVVLGGGLTQIHAEPVRVVATLPILSELARELGGDRVDVVVLTDSRQDPHFVQPRPTLMKRARAADLFLEVGLDLELWADKVVTGAGNPRIQTGLPGRVVVAKGVQTLEVPDVLTRDLGDVHPYGNPHIWLDPIRVREMAENIAGGLEAVDPGSSDAYRRRLADFQARLDEKLFGATLLRKLGAKKLIRLARRGGVESYLERRDLTAELGGWLARTRGLRSRKIVTYHKTWSYLAERFGLEVAIEIEEKPGIPPSAKHRDLVIERVRELGVRAIVIAPYYDRGIPDAIAAATGCRVVVVPIQPGLEETSGGRESYFEFMERLLSLLEKALDT